MKWLECAVALFNAERDYSSHLHTGSPNLHNEQWFESQWIWMNFKWLVGLISIRCYQYQEYVTWSQLFNLNLSFIVRNNISFFIFKGLYFELHYIYIYFISLNIIIKCILKKNLIERKLLSIKLTKIYSLLAGDACFKFVSPVIVA